MTDENNLGKLNEYLENTLAKRLLDSYKKDPTVASIQSVLESELASKTSPEETYDHPDKN